MLLKLASEGPLPKLPHWGVSWDALISLRRHAGETGSETLESMWVPFVLHPLLLGTQLGGDRDTLRRAPSLGRVA